jgi:hypothetical protein
MTAGTDTWTERTDVIAPILTDYGGEFAGVTRDGVPWLLSAIVDRDADPMRSLGVYGMTGVTVDSPRSARAQDARDPAITAAAVAATLPKYKIRFQGTGESFGGNVLSNHLLNVPNKGDFVCDAPFRVEDGGGYLTVTLSNLDGTDDGSLFDGRLNQGGCSVHLAIYSEDFASYIVVNYDGSVLSSAGIVQTNPTTYQIATGGLYVCHIDAGPLNL